VTDRGKPRIRADLVTYWRTVAGAQRPGPLDDLAIRRLSKACSEILERHAATSERRAA